MKRLPVHKHDVIMYTITYIATTTSHHSQSLILCRQLHNIKKTNSPFYTAFHGKEAKKLAALILSRLIIFQNSLNG